MIRSIEEGKKLNEIGEFLDEKETEFVQQVHWSGYPTGHELREIVEEVGGEWKGLEDGLETQRKNKYDTLNIPYGDGILVIERPFGQKDKGGYPIKKGHRTSFIGEKIPPLQEIKNYLSGLLKKEKKKAKEWFLKYRKSQAEGLATLFDLPEGMDNIQG